MEKKLERAFNLLDVGFEEGVFKGAVAAIGDKNGIMLEKSVGYREDFNGIKEDVTRDTLFDLASLTKVVGALPMVMKMVECGKLSVQDLVAEYLPEFSMDEDMRILNLLTHTSGFEPFSPLYDNCKNFSEAIEYISKSKRECGIFEKVIYSDYNFILIRAIIESLLKKPFEECIKQYVFDPLNMKNTMFNPQNINDIAATEYDKQSKKCLKGVVHDENARFLGGVSGHAGLFSNIEDLAKYCSLYLNGGKSFAADEKFISVPTINAISHDYTYKLNEDRGLGFGIVGENSLGISDLASKGTLYHTGFTGTSILIERNLGIYIILLTNRVHPTRENNKIIRFRRRFHNGVISSI